MLNKVLSSGVFFPRAAAKGLTVVMFCAISPLIPSVSAASEAGSVRITQIGESLRFLPLYLAKSQNFFAQQKLAVELLPYSPGPDITTAELVSGNADIGLSGPENAIYNFASQERGKFKIIASIANIDGLYLVSRRHRTAAGFDWSMLQGKTVLGWRGKTTPGLSLDEALRRKGVRAATGSGAGIAREELSAFRLRVRWFRGDDDFATFFATEASRLKRIPRGVPVASVGRVSGPMLYTVFHARTEFIRQRPEAVQRFVNAIQQALDWISRTPPQRDGVAPRAEMAARIAAKYVRTPFAYRGDSAAHVADMTTAYGMYRDLGYWNRDATVPRDVFDNLQAVMERSGEIAKRVAYEDVVAPEFAERAIKSRQR